MVSLLDHSPERMTSTVRAITRRQSKLKEWSAWRTEACEELSAIYSKMNKIYPLVEKIGYRESKVPIRDTTWDVWHALIDRLELQDLLSDLFTALTADPNVKAHWEVLADLEATKPDIDPSLLRRAPPYHAPRQPWRPPAISLVTQLRGAMYTADGFTLHCTKLDELASARMSVISRPSGTDQSAVLWVMFQPQLDELDTLVTSLEAANHAAWAPSEVAEEAMADSVADLRRNLLATERAARRAGSGTAEERRRVGDEIRSGIQEMNGANAEIIKRLSNWFIYHTESNQTVLQLQLLLLQSVCPLFVGWDKVWETVSARITSGLPWSQSFWTRLQLLNPHENGQTLALDAAYVTGLPPATSNELVNITRRYRRIATRFTWHRRTAANGDPPDALKRCVHATAFEARSELKAAKQIIQGAVEKITN